MNGKIFLQKLKARGISQSDIAEILGVTRQTVSGMKHTETVRTSTIEAIAKALGISISEFFDDEDEENKNAELKRLREENKVLKNDIKEKDATISRLIGIIEKLH